MEYDKWRKWKMGGRKEVEDGREEGSGKWEGRRKEGSEDGEKGRGVSRKKSVEYNVIREKIKEEKGDLYTCMYSTFIHTHGQCVLSVCLIHTHPHTTYDHTCKHYNTPAHTLQHTH